MSSMTSACAGAEPTLCLCCWPDPSYGWVRWLSSQEPLCTLAGASEEPIPQGHRGSASNSQPDLEENTFPLSRNHDLDVNKTKWLWSNAPKGLF